MILDCITLMWILAALALVIGFGVTVAARMWGEIKAHPSSRLGSTEGEGR